MKTYYTQHGNLSIPLKLGTRTIRIRFVSGDNITGYYETDNTEIQTALENDIYFGNKVFLKSTDRNIPENEPVIRLHELPEIDTWQKAKEMLLNAPYSISEKRLDTPQKIVKAAQQKGICFPNLIL